MHPITTTNARRAALTALAALLLAALPAGRAAAGSKLTSDEVAEFNGAVVDSSRAPWAIARLRSYLLTDPDSAYAFFTRRMITRGLVTTRAPGKDVIASIDTCSSLLPNDPEVGVYFWGESAQMLLQRNFEAPKALEFARRAYSNVPDGEGYAPLRGAILALLGQAQLANGNADAAVSALKAAVAAAPDSQAALFQLGRAYERLEKSDLAINAYVRALAVYMKSDTSAAAPLRALWIKKHGSVAGMDSRIDEMRSSARKRIAFDGRREVRPAPAWTLQDLDGKAVALDNFKGKVIVMDFWGSWCGPCRAELPVFQAMYESYRSKGVVFLGMNYERPVGDRDLKDVAREFVTKNKYTFPVIVDHEHVAADAYGISGFPTVFLIDKTGTIRYKNVGVTEGIETIIRDQIESLLN